MRKYMRIDGKVVEIASLEVLNDSQDEADRCASFEEGDHVTVTARPSICEHFGRIGIVAYVELVDGIESQYRIDLKGGHGKRKQIGVLFKGSELSKVDRPETIRITYGKEKMGPLFFKDDKGIAVADRRWPSLHKSFITTNAYFSHTGDTERLQTTAEIKPVVGMFIKVGKSSAEERIGLVGEIVSDNGVLCFQWKGKARTQNETVPVVRLQGWWVDGGYDILEARDGYNVKTGKAVLNAFTGIDAGVMSHFDMGAAAGTRHTKRCIAAPLENVVAVPEIKLKLSEEWLKRAAEAEDGCIVSVGGLVSKMGEVGKPSEACRNHDFDCKDFCKHCGISAKYLLLLIKKLAEAWTPKVGERVEVVSSSINDDPDIGKTGTVINIDHDLPWPICVGFDGYTMDSYRIDQLRPAPSEPGLHITFDADPDVGYIPSADQLKFAASCVESLKLSSEPALAVGDWVECEGYVGLVDSVTGHIIPGTKGPTSIFFPRTDGDNGPCAWDRDNLIKLTKDDGYDIATGAVVRGAFEEKHAKEIYASTLKSPRYDGKIYVGRFSLENAKKDYYGVTGKVIRRCVGDPRKD